MDEQYRHEGGSNRTCDQNGNLIGWLVFTDESRTNVRVVDREGLPLIVERTADGVTVRTEAGERREPRPATIEDPYYLGVEDDGSVRVYVDGAGKLCVPLQDFEQASGKAISANPRRDDVPVTLPINALTPRARRCLIRAGASAEQLGQTYIGTEHLLLALAEDPDGVAGQVLERLEVRSALKKELAAFIKNSGPSIHPHDQGDEVRVGFRHDEHGNPRIVLDP